MSWSTPLPEPFFLPNGKKVATLQEAADLILRLPKAKQGELRWIDATQCLMRAAEYPFPNQIAKANLALWRAMRREGMLAQTQKEKARA